MNSDGSGYRHVNQVAIEGPPTFAWTKDGSEILWASANDLEMNVWSMPVLASN